MKPMSKTKTSRSKRSPIMFVAKVSPVWVALLLAACASAPIPVVPDGSNRVPANDPARLSQFQQHSVQELTAVNERIALQAQLTNLSKELSDLRSVVRAALLLQPQAPVQVIATSSPVIAVPAQASTPTSPPSPITAAPFAETKSRVVEQTRNGIVVRHFYPFGKYEFNPNPELASALRNAAKTAETINVSGYTDSPVADAANNYVASARALSARRWLIANGVDGDRINSKFEGGAHFIEDNSTKAGQATNRRVELEIKGGNTSSLVSIQEKGSKS